MSQNPKLQRISPDYQELHQVARLHDLARLRAEQLRREAIAEWLGRCIAGAGGFARFVKACWKGKALLHWRGFFLRNTKHTPPREIQ